jgi:hypothetical protein
MKSKPASTKRAKKIIGATSGVTEILPIPDAPLTGPFHVQEDPGARGDHGSAGRAEIRKTTHRVMGSRQSQRPVERHDQPRKKR